MAQTENIKRIRVGKFLGGHGVRGLVRLQSFTEDPEAIFAYAPLTDMTGAVMYKVTRKSLASDHYLIAVEGVGSKETADALRGTELFITRDLLPPPDPNQYYEADLIGLQAFDAAGKSYGPVIAVHDFGAGTILEIGADRKSSFMLPFKDAFVPQVEIVASKIIISVPEGWI